MTGIVMVTHGDLGEAFRKQAEDILGVPPGVTTVSVNYDADPDQTEADLQAALANSADSGGVVVLTDLPGATPHNLAAQVARSMNVPLVSGLNLPMLLKAINHGDKPATELARVAARGARQGVTGP